MWLVIFGLICFWSGVAASAAHLFGWSVLPVTLGMGLFVAIVLFFVGALCETASRTITETEINIQTYFGGTFPIGQEGRGAAFDL
jgi:hypothetical protein